ncbi:DUF4091 domain-containing protein [Pseudodesulfovibrio methanolicus]|uniref:Glycoside hydrolase 123 N-terminal domain-containing protein n=1 Tax=Pseudodesulfovibrio methanolicus TaxID=3126690 RepID=A0ABZ2IYD8_9BACT
MKKLYYAVLAILFIVAWGVNARAGSITAVWVNNGEDKVVKDELRASKGADVANSVWDGRTIHLFAARNEVVNFNTVIESASSKAQDVRVSVSDLVSDDGKISSRKAEGDGVFDYRGRNIELFFVRYLQIVGLSQLAYSPTYDERHVPEKLQLPYTLSWSKAKSHGEFKDRPNAFKFYPDIAVPIEAVGSFSIPKGENQSIWTDIYVPRDAKPGIYKGTLTVAEGGGSPLELPIELEVLPLDMPDKFNAKTMVWMNTEDIYYRFTGIKWRDAGSVTPAIRKTMDTAWYRYMQMAKRHRVHMITQGVELFSKERFSRMGKVFDGELFTHKHDYEGPGYGVPSDIYSVGTYGIWRMLRSSAQKSKEAMWKLSNHVVDSMEKSYPDVEYFIYLKDEPHGKKAFAEVEQWAQWIKTNPGSGHRLKTFCTVPLPVKQQYMSDVDIALEGWGQKDVYQKALAKLKAEKGKVMTCNGWRPSSGTFMIEDDGVALRVNGWIQFKHNIDRWFFWAGTNYHNPSTVRYQTNVFREACTFGRKKGSIHSKYGEWGNGYGNGDGLLFYPGTDTVYPEDSYGLLGPIASLRLKLWRRGLQDYEYLRMAHEVDPQAVEALVKKMVPESLWELGVSNKNDPTYIHKGYQLVR